MKLNLVRAINEHASESVRDIDRQLEALADQMRKLAIQRAQLAVHEAIDNAFATPTLAVVE